jgi:hypothetical protein
VGKIKGLENTFWGHLGKIALANLLEKDDIIIFQIWEKFLQALIFVTLPREEHERQCR